MADTSKRELFLEAERRGLLKDKDPALVAEARRRFVGEEPEKPEFGEQVQAGLFKTAEAGTAGLSNLALAGSRALTKGIPFSEARKEISDTSKQIEKDFPTASTIGNIAGFVSPVGLASKGAGLVGKVASPLVRAVGGGAAGALAETGKQIIGQQEDLAAKDIIKSLALGAGVGAGTQVLGSALKGATKGAGEVGKRLLASLRGVKKESIDAFAKNPQVVNEAITKNVRNELIPEFVENLNAKVRDFVSKRVGLIDDILESTDQQIPVSPLIEATEQEIAGISRLQITPVAKQAVGTLQDVVNELKTLSNQSGGQLPARDVNIIKKQLSLSFRM